MAVCRDSPEPGRGDVVRVVTGGEVLSLRNNDRPAAQSSVAQSFVVRAVLLRAQSRNPLWYVPCCSELSRTILYKWYVPCIAFFFPIASFPIASF